MGGVASKAAETVVGLAGEVGKGLVPAVTQAGVNAITGKQGLLANKPASKGAKKSDPPPGDIVKQSLKDSVKAVSKATKTCKGGALVTAGFDKLGSSLKAGAPAKAGAAAPPKAADVIDALGKAVKDAATQKHASASQSNTENDKEPPHSGGKPGWTYNKKRSEEVDDDDDDDVDDDDYDDMFNRVFKIVQDLAEKEADYGPHCYLKEIMKGTMDEHDEKGDALAQDIKVKVDKEGTSGGLKDMDDFLANHKETKETRKKDDEDSKVSAGKKLPSRSKNAAEDEDGEKIKKDKRAGKAKKSKKEDDEDDDEDDDEEDDEDDDENDDDDTEEDDDDDEEDDDDDDDDDDDEEEKEDDEEGDDDDDE